MVNQQLRRKSRLNKRKQADWRTASRCCGRYVNVRGIELMEG